MLIRAGYGAPHVEEQVNRLEEIQVLIQQLTHQLSHSLQYAVSLPVDVTR